MRAAVHELAGLTGIAVRAVGPDHDRGGVHALDAERPLDRTDAGGGGPGLHSTMWSGGSTSRLYR